jgi:hypothetical protein
MKLQLLYYTVLSNLYLYLFNVLEVGEAAVGEEGLNGKDGDGFAPLHLGHCIAGHHDIQL